MPWYELNSADDPKFSELAERYQLHPLHVEDARSPDEGIKVDQTPHYTFAVLKPSRLIPAPEGSMGIGDISFSTIDIFAGNHIRIALAIHADVTDEQLEELASLGTGFSPVFDSVTNGVPVTVRTERMKTEQAAEAA